MRIVYFILFLTLTIGLNAHPWKPNHYVIIDTDGGFDDFRSIVMMLASPEIRVMGITVSNGVLDSKDTYLKTKSLLNDLYHQGIPVGINKNVNIKSKGCKAAQDFEWGKKLAISDSIISATDLINDLLQSIDDKVELVCLGSLNTAMDLVNMDGFNKDNLKKIIWSSHYNYQENNFNYNLNEEAFEFLINQEIQLELVDGQINDFGYNNEFIENLKVIKNPYSHKYISSLSAEITFPYSKKCFDESIALFFHYPQFYSTDTIDELIRHKALVPLSNILINQSFINIIAGQTIVQNQVFRQIPTDTIHYLPDVQKIMYRTIAKYGLEEWSACVITNELHRHLGVYAVIGAKMGIRAREYFGIGADEMKIVSYAGTVPPFSCMNDGLQVGTGGTIGHGLIKVDDKQKEPTAVFTYLENSITITLKNEYRRKIEQELKELSSIYGLDSNTYWELVRIAAIQYWGGWDRHEIFDIRVN